jgi:hypothetical protein
MSEVHYAQEENGQEENERENGREENTQEEENEDSFETDSESEQLEQKEEDEYCEICVFLRQAVKTIEETCFYEKYINFMKTWNSRDRLTPLHPKLYVSEEKGEKILIEEGQNIQDIFGNVEFVMFDCIQIYYSLPYEDNDKYTIVYVRKI